MQSSLLCCCFCNHFSFSLLWIKVELEARVSVLALVIVRLLNKTCSNEWQPFFQLMLFCLYRRNIQSLNKGCTYTNQCLKRIGLHKSRCTIVAVIDRFYVSAQNLSDTGRPHVGVNKDLHRDTQTHTHSEITICTSRSICNSGKQDYWHNSIFLRIWKKGEFSFKSYLVGVPLPSWTNGHLWEQ